MNSLVAYDSSSDDEEKSSSSPTHSTTKSKSNTSSHSVNSDTSDSSSSDSSDSSDSDSSDSSDSDGSIESGKFKFSKLFSSLHNDDEEDQEEIHTDVDESDMIVPGLLSQSVPRNSMIASANTAVATSVPEEYFRQSYHALAKTKKTATAHLLTQSSSSTSTTKHTDTDTIVTSGLVTEDTVIPDTHTKNTLLDLQASKPASRTSKPKRVHVDFDASSTTYTGPWALYEGELESRQTPARDEDDEDDAENDDEPGTRGAKGTCSKRNKNKKQKEEDLGLDFKETSQYHLPGDLHDSLGRSYVSYPSGYRDFTEITCNVPSKRSYSWVGHSSGVSCLALFPKSGHIMASASLDHSVKLWQTDGDKKCIRTLLGHSEGVRKVYFHENGHKLLTVSYDKSVKVWDTETGQVLHRIRVHPRDTPLCAAENPLNTNELLIGTKGNKIYQWDIRANESIQEYTNALGSVNTIEFLHDSNNSFVSSSDDKRILVYEYGIPVVSKEIMEPDLHSCPSIAMHPSRKYMVGNVMDNQAIVFAIRNSIHFNRKRRFTGHSTSGYACGLDFSPDGHYLVSGDAEGRLFYWSFKTGKLVKKVKAHDKVSIDVKWHPSDPTKVFSCSWDGTIKLWK